jgi:transposase-like protein
MRQRSFTKEQELRICEEYKAGTSSISLAKKYNVHSSTVIQAIRANNNKVRTVGEARRKYTYNHSFFKNIDTEAKAYFLGLILADGCVRNSVLEIGLQRKDRHILEAFVSCINGDNSIKDFMWKAGGFSKSSSPCSRLTITSAEMVADLKTHGIVDRKTYDICMPVLATELQTHFWRGVWDGDGYISLYDRKNKRVFKDNTIKEYVYKTIEVGICGHLNTCSAFQEFLTVNNIEFEKMRPCSSIFFLRPKHRDSIKFLDLIYRDSDPKLCLKRKYAKYQEYLEYKKVNEKSK